MFGRVRFVEDQDTINQICTNMCDKFTDDKGICESGTFKMRVECVMSGIKSGTYNGETGK